jgi:hypothetical protein
MQLFSTMNKLQWKYNKQNLESGIGNDIRENEKES